MVRYAREHLRKIVDDHEDTMILHSVNYAEFFAGVSDRPVEPPLEFPWTRKLLELDKGLQVVDMREYIPFYLGAETAATWYHHPYGLEKWTDEGTRMYARAVAEAVRVRLARRPAVR